jgi:hypothetical protein
MSDAIEELRREKQAFLKAEIIDAGYEGSDFAAFLNQIKPDGNSNLNHKTSRGRRYRLLDNARVISGTISLQN